MAGLLIVWMLWGAAGVSAAPPEPMWAPLASELQQEAKETSEQVATPPSRPASHPVAAWPKSDKPISQHTRGLIMQKFESMDAYFRRPLPKMEVDEFIEVQVGEPLDEDDLKDRLTSYGVAFRANEPARVTSVVFTEGGILVDLNGGSPRKKKWHQREMTITGASGGGGVINPGSGSYIPGRGVTVLFKFGKAIPNISVQEFEGLLGLFLDFSRIPDMRTQQRIDLVPEEFKPSVLRGDILPGMDGNAVELASEKRLGKPEFIEQEGNELRYVYDLGSRKLFVVFVPRMVNGKFQKWIVREVYEGGG